MDALFYKDTMYGGGGAMRGNYFNPIIYSTEEREVGVWTDNKPLYQKTWIQLNAVIPYDTWTNLVAIANVEKMVSWGALDENGKNLNGIGIIFQYYNGYVQGAYTQNHDIRKIDTFTMWYTKTTDVAGSGKYNTLGVPNVHYTTDEQVIGTWLGETLYERTFNGLATNTNGDNWVNIGGIDATTWKDAVNVEIYCNSSDVNNKLTRIALGEARVFNCNVQVTTSVSYNRQINVATIQYTKTS